MENLILDQISSAAIVVFILEWLKKQSWFTWLTDESTKRVKAVFSLVFGVLAVAGVGYVWTPDAHTLTITGLSLTTIVVALFEVIKQYVTQKFIYKLVKPKVSALPAATMIQPPVFERLKV